MKSAFFSLLFVLSTSIFNHTIFSVVETFKIQITDQSGYPLKGATVTVFLNDELIFSGFTDMNGTTSLEVDAEEVDIQVSLTGYRERELKSVKTGEKFITISLQRKAVFEEILTVDDPSPKLKKAYDAEPSFPAAMDISSSFTRSGGSGLSRVVPDSKLPGSGQVTAGEWNDLHNWREWKQLINSEDYKYMTEIWGIHTDNRYSVLVLNKKDIPIPGAHVKLLDQNGTLIWQAYTDVSGKAELYQGPFGESRMVHQVLIEYNGEIETIRQINHSDRGAMVARLKAPCPETLKIDISWIVDATSSMSDEIEYLQAELLDVIDRVKSVDKDINWSSIFYRDNGDEYVTKVLPFSDHEDTVLNFIKSQHAHGGGDFPEAVSEAIQEMTTVLNWRTDSDVKLCFLLLDAPPHEDIVSMNKYRQSIREAAAKGIKIIPVSASGINRETEFLMKFTSILTNGTYVFITDDSGIGNPHLDPVVNDYKVEKLNDLLVRLINSYTTLTECDEAITDVSPREIRFYPNPASDLITIENLVPQDEIQLISTSGMIVKSVVIEQEKIQRFDISDLVSGHYILRIKGTDRTRDYRLLVIT